MWELKKTKRKTKKFDEKMKKLTGELEELMETGLALDEKIKENLKKIGYGF